MNPVAWDIIHEFALSNSITLPDIESCLKTLLGLDYVEQDWKAAIDAIFAAEHDTNIAIQEVERLATAAANASRLTICIQCPSGEQIALQVLEIEKGLVAMVEELHKLKGIKENIPSVDELVEPKEECEVGVETDKLVSMPSGDAEIVVHVKHVIAVEKGEIMEVDDSEDDNDSESDLCAGLTFSDVMQMCEKLEAACWKFGYSDNGLALPHELRHFCGFLRHMEMKNVKQTTLDSFWAI